MTYSVSEREIPMAIPVPAGRTVGPTYKWWVVVMLWFICFFNYADRQAIFSIFPVLEKEFGFNDAQLGLIGSAFMWVYALGAPIAGFVADRTRRKNLILGGCIFWSLVTMTTGRCTKLWHFVTARALEGGGETFYFPASVAMTSDYHGPATRSRALSIHQSSVYVGTIMGSWLGAWLAQHFGWRLGFYFFGAAGLVLALVLFRFLREPSRGQGESPAARVVQQPLSMRQTLGAVFRCPTAVMLMIVFFGANFVAMVFLTWTPMFLVKKFDYQLAAAGLSGTLFIHLAAAVTVPLAGALADRWARHFAGGRILVQAIGLVVGAGFVMTVGHTRDTRVLIAAMTAFGACKGFYDSGIFASMYDAIEPRARASAAGMMNLVGWAGGGLGPLAIGWAATHGRHASKVDNMSDAIALGGYVYLIGAALLLITILLFARRDLRQDQGGVA
jgi:MFS family permease